MSKEELYKALKIFNREDLTYENDEFYNDFEEYMNFMEQEKAIEVFMSTRDMVKYSKLEQEIERLNKIIEIKNNRIQQLMNRTRSARIDKAIAFIKSEKAIKCSGISIKNFEAYENYLLSVLEGSDKE